METFLIKAAQLILALAFLIIIHEFGHFFFARLFGVRVEKFYIFFDPWIELFKWKPRKYIGGFGKSRRLGRKYVDPVPTAQPDGMSEADTEECESKKEGRLRRFWGHTEYGIGWVPLGGYCKISGMIDESMDIEQMKLPPKEWEFRSKPAWQRLLIMVAGVLFNFLLAILIYAGIVYATGEKYVSFPDATLGMAYSPEAQKAGLRDGDIPLKADGKPLDDPAKATVEMLQARNVTVLRDGKETTVAIPKNLIFRLDEEQKRGDTPINFMMYRIPTVVSQTAPGEGAENAGIKAGDHIIAVDSTATPSLDIFLRVLEGHEGQNVMITVTRPRGNVDLRQAARDAASPMAAVDTLRLPVKLNENSKMGIGLEIDPTSFFNTKEIHYSLLASVPRGIEMGIDKLTSYAKSMKLVFTKEGAKSIGGFGAIGSIFPEKWDWIAFWNIAAFLSVALAFMNILPIPALDGGHVLFLLYEIVFRRKPSEKFLEHAQIVGMSLLLLLLLYANGMDIVRFFFK